MIEELRLLETFSGLKLRVGFATLLFLFLFSLAGTNTAQVRPSPVPPPVPFNPIVDNAQIIDPATRQQLEAIFLNLKERGQIEYAVLTVPTTGDLDIFDFTIAVARGWGIGSKDGEKAAFLLVVAVQDRKYSTQVSRHLEGDLPDGLTGQIQRERLVPAFRQQNYSKGILDTIKSYAATLGAKRGFSVEGIEQRYVYDKEPRDSGVRETSPKSLTNTCCGIAVVLFIIILLFTLSRRGGRGGGGGCLQALLWGSLFSNLTGGSRGGSSSGWGGGGFGGGGGGFGGGGFGGGFGGGGDFGGGGSSGSW